MSYYLRYSGVISIIVAKSVVRFCKQVIIYRKTVRRYEIIDMIIGFHSLFWELSAITPWRRFVNIPTNNFFRMKYRTAKAMI